MTTIAEAVPDGEAGRLDPRALPRKCSPALGRLRYLARIARVYARPSTGPLSFWHERPEINDAAFGDGQKYFMRFQRKAAYAGPFDDAGIPLLDYRGDIGKQYNPIAIAQYGLARFNRWCDNADEADRAAWVAVAQWLTKELKPNVHGVPVWFHHFDWPYRQLLKAPWYSGLAQGNGLSMLVRAARATGDPSFADSAHRAFQSFERSVRDGGVLVTDERGHVWIEEYLVDPPSHILNGFIWALWGVHDYARWTGNANAEQLWRSCLRTLEARLDDFDTGWWSLYESPHNARPMLASRYYHTLHIIQLRVLHRLSGIETFAARADRFEAQLNNRVFRMRALAGKALFKLRNY
jgi:heparosan-N-sulfate-glucuronate 5-epimerase